MTRSAIRRASATTSVLALVALTAFATAGPAAAETLPPAYYPEGPQLGVEQSELEGWELCYSDLYGTYEVPLYGDGGVLDELCTGEFLLLAGAPVDSTELTLLAAAPRADVLFDTGENSDVLHDANGTSWYFNANRSWGFVLPGTEVQKHTCDVRSNDAEYRLCFHASNNELEGGYRLGALEDLNDSSDYVRYVYQAAGTPAPAPAPAPAPELAATGVDSSAPLFLAGGLLLVGLVGLAATRRRSA